MNAMLTKRKTKIVLLFIICFANLTVLIIPQTPLSTIGNDDLIFEPKFPYAIKPANNDTTAPVIVFIKPDINDTTFTGKSYDIIVNITDDNPPLPGNVSIEVSNATTSLFNASMINDEGSEWFFTWDNITSYPNKETYTFKVTAKDSSANENIGISGVINVYVELSKSPGVLNVILYFIAASVIIASILVYINKKHAPPSSRKQY